MSKINLTTVGINQMVQGFVCVDTAEVKNARNNKSFLNLIVSDGEITMSAKKWDHTGDIPKAGTVIKIQGSVGEYQGTQQIIVERWRNINDTDNINIDEFIKRSVISPEELWDTISKYISLIQDTDYHNITRYIFQKYKDYVLKVPAALHHHNAYMGGLAEHLIDVTRNALTMADEDTNLALLIAGAILHDIGKIYTYAYDGLAIVMTDAGKLLDHIVIGNSILFAEGQAIGTPMEKLLLLQHIISSHHGKLEWGSPITPKFTEAFIIHQADMASVITTKMHSIHEKTAAEDKWSTYYRDLGTDILTTINGKYVVDAIPSTIATEYKTDTDTLICDEGVE